MGGVPGPGGPAGPSTAQANTSTDNVTTVQTGETTLKKVAERLGGDITEEALLQANAHLKNPNQLQAGQDIRLPEKTTGKEANSTKPKSQPAEGFKGPTIRKGNWEVSGTYKGETSSVADGEGSSVARREKREQLDGMRPRDDRDKDPAQLKKEKDLARLKQLEAGDPTMKDIEKQSPDAKLNREVGDAKELNMREQMLRKEGERIRQLQKNINQK